MNRFFDTPGVINLELSPWEIVKRGLDIEKAWFENQDPIPFNSTVLGGIILVEAKTVSDLASIPKLAQSIFMLSDDPRIALGAWIHDWLYKNKGLITLSDGQQVRYTREMADKVLAYECMQELGASKMQQNAVYYNLRWFGIRW